MATLATIKKHAKKEFIPNLEKLGFNHQKAFHFIRQRNEFYDVIFGEILSSGQSLRLIGFCWTPEVNPDLDLIKHLKQWSIIAGGNIGDRVFPDIGHLWDIDEKHLIEEQLRIAFKTIRSKVIPWFDQIQSREDFVRNVNIATKAMPSWEKRKVRILQSNSSLPKS